MAAFSTQPRVTEVLENGVGVTGQPNAGLQTSPSGFQLPIFLSLALS